MSGMTINITTRTRLVSVKRPSQLGLRAWGLGESGGINVGIVGSRMNGIIGMDFPLALRRKRRRGTWMRKWWP